MPMRLPLSVVNYNVVDLAVRYKCLLHLDCKGIADAAPHKLNQLFENVPSQVVYRSLAIDVYLHYVQFS